MKKNIGGIDLQLRYVLAAIFVLVALFAPLDPAWKAVLLITAAIALITAITGL